MSDLPTSAPTPTFSIEETILKDLEFQWADHRHMRDQTWKIFGGNIALFSALLAFIAQKSDSFMLAQKPDSFMLIAAGLAGLVVCVFSVFGWATTAHHRHRQRQKFKIITLYEKKLGLYELKKEFIEGSEANSGLPGKIFTSHFPAWIQGAMAVIASSFVIFTIVKLFGNY